MRPPATRAWTVELRPHPQGPVLACAHCPLEPETLQGHAARSAALAHLARHARRSLLPQHLRTCQCHERGCRWHPRHRGCAGPLLLVLSRARGGRLWRLADTCLACARAMPDASVIPETTLNPATGPSPTVRRRSSRSRHEEAERALVDNMLSYLAASLPPHVSAEARALAVQCVLRSDSSGLVHLPPGLTRSLALRHQHEPWEELAATDWLRPTASTTSWLIEPLIGAPSRRCRVRAADWFLRSFRSRDIRHLPAEARLVAVALASHTPARSADGVADSTQLARRCGLPPAALIGAIQLLVGNGSIKAWSYEAETGDLRWTAAMACMRPGSS